MPVGEDREDGEDGEDGEDEADRLSSFSFETSALCLDQEV